MKERIEGKEWKVQKEKWKEKINELKAEVEKYKKKLNEANEKKLNGYKTRKKKKMKIKKKF